MDQQADANRTQTKVEKKQSTKSGNYDLQKDLQAYEATLGTLKADFDKRWNSVSKQSSTTRDDFKLMRTIGEGEFGKVLLAQHKKTNRYHAMKILSKEGLVQKSQITKARDEMRVLLSIKFPFVISMDYYIKDNLYLYFVMPFASGGDMFAHIQQLGKFDEKLAIFYAAQVTLALEYLHHCKLIYRDLKPENIMIDNSGYLKVTDFGFCKKLEKNRTWTLCGTPEYLAPEIIKCKEYGFAVDWWSFGVLIYEMNAGYSPFFSPDPMKLYVKIINCDYKFPLYFEEDLKNLINNLLQIDLSKRFGNLKAGPTDIKTHRWFKSVNWKQIYEQKLEPPFVPNLSHEGDTKYFTDQLDVISLKTSKIDPYHDLFRDF